MAPFLWGQSFSVLSNSGLRFVCFGETTKDDDFSWGTSLQMSIFNSYVQFPQPGASYGPGAILCGLMSQLQAQERNNCVLMELQLPGNLQPLGPGTWLVEGSTSTQKL